MSNPEETALDRLREQVAGHLGMAPVRLTIEDAKEISDQFHRMGNRFVGLTQGVQEMLDEALKVIQRTALEDLSKQVPHDIHTRAAIIAWIEEQAKAI